MKPSVESLINEHAEPTPSTPPPHTPLSVTMMLHLAAPHTWPAAIIPVLVAFAASCVSVSSVSLVSTFVLLAICLLMQSSVNAFNDYYDYVKGSDSADDNIEEDDAVLLYNNINPQSVLKLAICFLISAFILGIYIIYRAGLIPLALGITGAVIVVLYSAGKTPISYLPIGELVSGFVMGGLIFLACFITLTNTFNIFALVWSIPIMLGIGLIMMTNNTCDIEKDCISRRRTLSVILGRQRCVVAYHIAVFLWVAAIIINLFFFFTPGLCLVPFMLLSVYPQIKAISGNPLNPPSRIGAMGQICSVNITLGVFYAFAILFSALEFSIL